MSTPDRELLEKAAKAAGLWTDADPWNGLLKSSGLYWNPLRDDGDALRLMVKLHMHLTVSKEKDAVSASAAGGLYVGEPFDGDPQYATRRCIVRAAAAIGDQS